MFLNDDFINFGNMRFYNDEEIDEVGEYEVDDRFDGYYDYYDDFSPADYGMRGMNQSMPPTAPPPDYIPSKSQLKSAGPSPKAVEPGTIRPCLFQYVYIWQTNGRSYWAYLTYIGRKSIAGWRWTGRRWIYFGLDLKKVETFICL